MPRRKNDPAKVESASESENKRLKTDSEVDVKDEGKKQETKEDLMKIPIPDENGVLLICGGTNWSVNGRKKPRKGDEKYAKVGKNLFKPHRYSSLLDVEFSKIISGCTANHSLAITKDGSVYSWGRNECGQLGHGGTDRYELPKLIESLSHMKIVHAAVGRNHTLCLTESGKVFAFGENAQGQLGISKINSYVPSPTQLKISSFAVDVACGAEFSMVVDINGSVYSFGCPEYGQLGNNTDGKYFVSSNKLSYDNVSTPFRIPLWREKTRTGQVIPIPDVKIVRVVCGANHTIAMDSKKRVFTWGFGGYGRLGHSEQKDEHTPRLVEAFDREMRGAARIFAGSTFSMAVNEMGATFFWGLQGSISCKDTTMYPKLIQDLTGWNIKSIACGQRHIAVSADDNVIVWGIGTTSGELIAAAEVISKGARPFRLGICGTAPWARAHAFIVGQRPEVEEAPVLKQHVKGLGESRKSSTNPQLLKALEGLSVLEVACGSAYTIFKVRNDSSEDKEKLKMIPVYEPNALK